MALNPPLPARGQSKAPFLFSSDEGRLLCRSILSKFFPYQPHDVQIEAISKLLDGVDVFAILRTGMGKTSIISMYMRVMLSVIEEPSLCPEAALRFKNNPCIVVILPTKYLEHQMADIMSEAGLKTLVINADTIHNAHLESPSRDLWKDAVTQPQVIFMAPEQLISKGCTVLLNHKEFAARVCGLVVDEAHLLNTWGAGFRKSYKQVGWVRARLPEVVLLALSATVRADDLSSICDFLGLHPGQFHLLKRSNSRPEIQIIFRHLKSGLAGKRFPELDWILTENRRTIIFCRTINLGFRVYRYLCAVGKKSDPNIAKHVRMYNALNWPSFNDATRQMLQSDPSCRIAIGTDTMSVGVDIPNIEDVIVIDEPENIDELIQKFGRVGRDRTQVSNPRAILYTGSKTLETARAVVDGSSPSKAESDTGRMDLSMALLHLAKCKPKEIDCQYGNSADTPLSSLPTCNCSGCLPDPSSSERTQPSTKTTTPSNAHDNTVPRGKRLTKVMRAHGTTVLAEFRLTVWRAAAEQDTGFLPPPAFFSDAEIKIILDRFALITNEDDIKHLLDKNQHLKTHIGTLHNIITKLRLDFKKIAADRKEELRRQKAMEKQACISEGGSDQSTGLSGTESEIDFSAEEEEARVVPATSQWRVIKSGSAD